MNDPATSEDLPATPTEPLPWAMVETLPSADRSTVDRWDQRLTIARSRGDDRGAVRAAVGAAISRYWAHQMLGSGDSWTALEQERVQLIDDAERVARSLGDDELVATALLGRLYACWGPPRSGRAAAHAELVSTDRGALSDELRERIDEWTVLDALDRGETALAGSLVESFARTWAPSSGLARRRTDLWRSNLAMLHGELDDAVRRNQEAVSGTAEIAGSPAAFQNAAVVIAIERYLRRGLVDVVEAVRSIRASAVRVGANWDVAYAFTLAETGDLERSATVLEVVAEGDFSAVVPDLNWLVTMHLIGLTVVHLRDRSHAESVLEQLLPFGSRDATHGMGYASYGPIARVLGLLCRTLDRHAEARSWFDSVIDERPDGPWVALTLLDRSRLSDDGDPPSSEPLADAARSMKLFQRFSMEGWIEQASLQRTRLHLDGHGSPSAVRGKDGWALVHPTGTAHLPRGAGTDMFVHLLRSAGRSWSTHELEGLDPDHLPNAAVQERSLDGSARAAYGRRLRELRRLGDSASAAEIELLRSELGAARYVKSSSAELERARIRVTTSLRRSIERIAEDSHPLAQHLRASIVTGRQCLYAPVDGCSWTIVRA